MSLPELIAEIVSNLFAPGGKLPSSIDRIVSMVVSGVIGIICLAMACVGISQLNAPGFIIGLFFLGLAGVCSLIFWRQTRH